LFWSYNNFQDYIDRTILNKSSYIDPIFYTKVSIEKVGIVSDYYPSVIKLDKKNGGYDMYIPLSSKFSDGSKHDYSLMYQYKNGSFQLLKITEILK
jgi:hypothetical protein